MRDYLRWSQKVREDHEDPWDPVDEDESVRHMTQLVNKPNILQLWYVEKELDTIGPGTGGPLDLERSV